MVDVKQRLRSKAIRLLLKDKFSEALEVIKQILEVLES